MSIDIEMKKKQDYMNGCLKKYLPAGDGIQAVMFEAMEYSLLAGGKRLRPMLVMEMFDAMSKGEQPDELKEMAERFAVALEMIHTYSLVHDDLPAMDNDRFRRGKLTTHAAYGHANGVLAGDALLNYSMELVAEGACCLDLSEEYLRRVLKAERVLYRKAGVYGMIGGQAADVAAEELGEDASKSLEWLLSMYRLKTSALLEAAMMIGAILAGASDENVDTTERLAGNVGLAFQIRDDILDITSTDEILGKPVKSDSRNGKTTVASLLGLKEAEKYVDRYSELAAAQLEELGIGQSFLNELILKLAERKY